MRFEAYVASKDKLQTSQHVTAQHRKLKFSIVMQINMICKRCWV